MRCRGNSGRCGGAKFVCLSLPVPCAEPICTSSTENCRNLLCRSVPGHEIVGRVTALGHCVTGFRLGDRVGVPWLGWTCGQCEFCTSGRENLCPRARFTGYQIDGGFAAVVYADARYAFHLPEQFGDAEAAPLVRRFDRMARAEGHGNGPAPRLVRFRGRGAYRSSGGAFPRAGSVCVRAAGRPARPPIRVANGCRLGRTI